MKHGPNLHLAFLGCGHAAAMHRRTLASLGAAVRCSWASRDEARARSHAARHGDAWYAGYDDALADPRVDVVLVATPPATHLDLTLRALDARKHVIVEKPPFLRAADVEVARAAAERAGRRVLVAENYFYKPLAVALRRALAGDEIGEVLFVHVNALKHQHADGWRADPALAGGGALFEGGVHWVNLIANLGLSPRRIRALRPGVPGGAERSVLLTIEYAEGAVGSLLYSWEVPSPLRGLRVSHIYGRRGSITFESNGLALLVRGARTRLLVPGLADLAGYKAMFLDFLASLRAGAEPQLTLEIAGRDLALIEEAYASMQIAQASPVVDAGRGSACAGPSSTRDGAPRARAPRSP